MPDKTTPEEWIELLVRKAAALREAGVLTVESDGCTASLAPVEPDMPEFDDPPKEQDQYTADPLNSTDTYGGPVPKIMNHRERDE